MFDNFYNIHEYNGLSCSSDCQTLSNLVVQTTRGMIILYLTTILTMFDNIINRVRNI